MVLTEQQQTRNAALEEAAVHLETMAGEAFNNGQAYHDCANATRLLKDCPECGQRMSDWWDGKNWVPHQCGKSSVVATAGC